MEPFSITCHSCAARLKVARPELIDQTLACPKCGSMIHVQHPTGWKPPIPESKGSLSALSSVVSGNDFDQIEDLLPKPGEKNTAPTPNSPNNTNSPANQKPGKPRFQNPGPATAAPRPKQNGTNGDDQPIMPGQQWSNPSTQQRKNLTLMIGSAIATVILVAISIATIVRLSSGTPDTAGKEIAAADPTETTADDTESPAASDDAATTDEPATSPEPEQTNQDSGFLDDRPTIPQLPIEQNPDADQTPPINPGGPDRPRFSAPEITTGDPEPPAGNNPPAADNANTPPKNSKSLEDLLVEQGVSAGELADVATLLRSDEDTSRPKFSVTPTKPRNANFQRLLELPIHTLDAPNGISLVRAARTVSQLSGVPIAVDVRQLSLMGLPANPTLKLAIKDETTLSTAEKLAELAGAKATVVGDGIFISLPASQQKSNFELAFPNVGELQDEEKQRFLDSIQALIAPDAWTDPISPATIRFEGDTILLNSGTGVQQHIQMLIQRMNAAVEFTAAPNNEDAASAVASRWAASEPLRKQPTGWSTGPALTLADFLDRIERLHSLSVVVDWPSALAAGWTPLAQVPGDLVEPDVGEAIRHLSKAMNFRVIGIDAKTLLLTTSQTAYDAQDLEVYPILADWADQTKPEEIEQLIFTALGQQVTDSFVRVVFEPKCHSLIVVASQPIQHQVQKLVERLNQAVDAEGNDR